MLGDWAISPKEEHYYVGCRLLLLVGQGRIGTAWVRDIRPRIFLKQGLSLPSPPPPPSSNAGSSSFGGNLMVRKYLISEFAMQSKSSIMDFEVYQNLAKR